MDNSKTEQLRREVHQHMYWAFEYQEDSYGQLRSRDAAAAEYLYSEMRSQFIQGFLHAAELCLSQENKNIFDILPVKKALKTEGELIKLISETIDLIGQHIPLNKVYAFISQTLCHPPAEMLVKSVQPDDVGQMKNQILEGFNKFKGEWSRKNSSPAPKDAKPFQQ